MGKHEPMSAKAIGNKIKAKGLQKIKYYCEMCKKQCRDDNGFKCHIMSEAHQRQALIVCENPEKFVSEFSKQFMEGFIYILKTRYRTKRILANTVFQEYIKERDHIHMNGTRWTSLTEFANWLGENGIVKVDESERGVMVTYIDRDPETLRRQELDAKRTQQAKETAKRAQKEIEMQREAANKVYKDLEVAKQPAEPIPMQRVPIHEEKKDDLDERLSSGVSHETDSIKEPGLEPGQTSKDVDSEVVERPVFKMQTMTLKSSSSSSYKPPSAKRKICIQKLESVKKMKNK